MMEDEPIALGGMASERQIRCALDVAAANWLIEAKDLDGARRVLVSALASVPHDVRARALLALVLFRLGDFIAASELYERLLSEFRDDIPLTFNLALCHLKSGRADAAAIGLRRVLAADPDHTRARAWLRVAESVANPFTPSMPPASVRTSRLEDLPRVTIAPEVAAVRDESGVVSVRIDRDARWLARPEAVQGYAGDVRVETRAGEGLVELSGSGTAFLSTKGGVAVIELHAEETCVRASSLVAYGSNLSFEAADPEVIGELGDAIVRFEGRGAIVVEARAKLVALPVSLIHATTVRWDNVVGWTGNVVGAPAPSSGADGHALARFAGNGSLLLAIHDDGAVASAAGDEEWYGRYQVLRRLEGTPSEEVLLARSHGPGGFQRKVILKRHLHRCDGDSQLLQQVAEEAHAYALLTHPGIVRLYDFLLIDGHPVLVLEYVRGVSLAAMDMALRGQPRAGGDWLALYIAHGIFGALAAAHDARDPDSGEPAPIVHGDVHPGNVLLGWNGDVKLASFATRLARSNDGSAPGSARPMSSYMAPEQVSGSPVTVSTDVYVASLVLYEMLTQRRAFDPLLTGTELARALAEPSFPSLDTLRPDLSTRIRDALRIALSPDPQNRSLSAADLARAIEQAADLRSARTKSVEVLEALRDSAFGGGTHSSRPPPPVTDGSAESGAEGGDTEVFRAMLIPKAARVPQFGTNVKPAVKAPPPHAIATPTISYGPRGSLAAVALQTSDAPPASQRSPFREPRSYAHIGRARGRAAAGIGIGAVAVVLAAVAWLPRSNNAGRAAATESPSPAATAIELAPLAEVAPRVERHVEQGASAPIVVRADATAEEPSTAAAESESAEPEPENPIPSDQGIVTMPPRAAGHRVFVDGHLLGEGEDSYVVHCGPRMIRIGSKGEEQRIDVPCGDAISIE